MLNQPAFPSSAASRSGTPLQIDAVPANEGNTSAQGADYVQWLEKFPQASRKDLQQHLPTLKQLTDFHQQMLDHELPLTEKSVAFALGSYHDHRSAQQERDRIHYLTEFQGDDHIKAHDIYGATLLQHAILIEDPGLARALFVKSTVDTGAIVQPKMRLRDWTRIGYAVSSLPPSSGQQETHQAILGALKRRDHPGGRTAMAFAGHNGDNPLTFALSRHASATMTSLLVDHYAAHAPAMLSAPDANGLTPLLAAVASGRTDIAKLLLKQPAVNINDSNAQGRNAVMEAIVAGDGKMLDLLLTYSPDLDLRDARGRTPQELAIDCDATEFYMKLMQARWLAASAVDDKQRVNELLIRDFRTAALAGKLAMVKAMLAGFGSSLAAKVIASVLSAAVGTLGCAQVVACLLDPAQTHAEVSEIAMAGLELAAADANMFNIVARAVYPANPIGVKRDKLQALMHGAATLGLTHWVLYAIDGGLDMDDYDAGHLSIDGSSALMKSFAFGHDELTIALLSRKASLLDVDGSFDNCALAAASADTLDPARVRKNMALILEHHPDLYARSEVAAHLCRIAVTHTLPTLIDRLVADGKLLPKSFDGDGQSLLLQVLANGSLPLLTALLQKGAPNDALLEAFNGDANAALAFAANHGLAEHFDLVLRACHVSPTDDRDLSLWRLAQAAKVGSSLACGLLMDQAGVVLPITATRRLNPVLQAVIGGHHDTLTYLLQRGAHGLLKYKTVYKSAIEKALAMKDPKAVGIVLAHDRHCEAELQPVMEQLMAIAIANEDALSYEHLTKAMIKFERSNKKYQQCVENAIDIGCTAAVKLILVPKVMKTLPEQEREALFRRALGGSTPTPGIVLHFLEVEGHPRNQDGKFDEFVHILDAQCSGARRLVNALVATDAPDEQKLFWMATIFCQSYLDPTFSAARDMAITHWGKLVAPLAKSMKGDASYAVALGMAAAMAVTSGKPKLLCDIFFNVAPRVLDVDIDLMAAGEAILATKRLDLLELLPVSVRYQLQARYRSQLGAPYTH